MGGTYCLLIPAGGPSHLPLAHPGLMMDASPQKFCHPRVCLPCNPEEHVKEDFSGAYFDDFQEYPSWIGQWPRMQKERGIDLLGWNWSFGLAQLKNACPLSFDVAFCAVATRLKYIFAKDSISCAGGHQIQLGQCLGKKPVAWNSPTSVFPSPLRLHAAIPQRNWNKPEFPFPMTLCQCRPPNWMPMPAWLCPNRFEQSKQLCPLLLTIFSRFSCVTST